MNGTCAHKDLVSQRVAWLLWGLPAVALALGAVVGPVARTTVWTAAFLVASVSCAVNARRCGRTHCYFTGPLYFLAAIATLLVGLGVVALGWSWIPAVAIGGTVLAYVPEWLRGKYL
jgi:hypothetical protein